MSPGIKLLPDDDTFADRRHRPRTINDLLIDEGTVIEGVKS